MVTRNNTQLATCTLPVGVIKTTFPLLALVRYLLQFTPVNSYLTRCSWENFIFATASGIVSTISCGVSLVTIPLLDLLIFHWIQWKSFRENSIYPMRKWVFGTFLEVIADFVRLRKKMILLYVFSWNTQSWKLDLLTNGGLIKLYTTGVFCAGICRNLRNISYQIVMLLNQFEQLLIIMLPETVMCVTDGQVTRKRTFPTAFNNWMTNAGLKILQNIRKTSLVL